MKKADIEKLVDETLSSADGANRATANPYLLTRLNAALQNDKESAWERIIAYLSKPAIAMTGLILVIAINVFVIAFNNQNMGEEPYTSSYDYTSSVTLLDDIENTDAQ
jgi:membrane-bound ClpP family serine protease